MKEIDWLLRTKTTRSFCGHGMMPEMHELQIMKQRTRHDTCV